MLRMAPEPWRFMAGTTARMQRNGPRRLTPSISSNCSSVSSSMGPKCPRPALLTRMSRRPNSSSVCSTMTCTERSSRTSAGTTSARRPRARTFYATCSRSGTVRAASATSAPARDSASATPRPIQRDAHVTRAALCASGRAAGAVNSALFVVVALAPSRGGLGRGLVLLVDAGRRVPLGLARQGEGQAPRLEVDLADDDVDLLVEAVALARVVPPRRGEDVRDVEQAEDARLELDEDAVLLHPAHPPVDRCADHVARLGAQPGIVGELLQADRHAAGVLVHVEHLDLQALVHGDDLAGVADVLPRHLAHVEERVDPAQVEEGAELGDRLHRALDDLARLPAPPGPARLVAALGQRLLQRGRPLRQLAPRPRRLGPAGERRRLPVLVAGPPAGAGAAAALPAAGQGALGARPAGAIAVLRLAPLGALDALDALDARGRAAAGVDAVTAVDALQSGDLQRIEVAARGRDEVVGDGARHARDHDLLAEAIARHGDDAQEVAVAGHEQDRRDGRAVEHRLDDVDEHVHVGAGLAAVPDLVGLHVDGGDARDLQVAQHVRRELFEVRVGPCDVDQSVLACGFDEERGAGLHA